MSLRRRPNPDALRTTIVMGCARGAALLAAAERGLPSTNTPRGG